MKILLADDDAVTRTVVAHRLRRWGHEVVEVDDGAQADRLLSTDLSIDLAVLDWVMPEMDGIGVTVAARARAVGQRPYIILLTGKDRFADRIAALEAGVDEFLPKPADPELLAQRLDRAHQVLFGPDARPAGR